VDGGDTLTWTLVLRNSSAATATVALTDPLPAHTSYLAGSAQASDGGPVQFGAGQLSWSGQVISGTPVVIQFATRVSTGTLALGESIVNVAWLDDGLGHVFSLEAASVHNPGYRLSINDGALFTNNQDVTLALNWDAGDGADEMQFSNDGGFGVTSGWFPVAATHAPWELDTYGSLLIPRVVYARFQDAGGSQYGPIQDDIVYDPHPPRVTGVELVWQQPADLIVRVTSSDDNSGVSVVQLSHDVDMGQYTAYAASAGVMDIRDFQPSGRVYVRAVDRAGNVSEIVGAFNGVYLPVLLKH
jgi:uncharacterized repeat protein (TIGR01451 family)